jgi:hypothetical protein
MAARSSSQSGLARDAAVVLDEGVERLRRREHLGGAVDLHPRVVPVVGQEAQAHPRVAPDVPDLRPQG